MPPRLNKRQQRELEELESLGGVPDVSPESGSEGEARRKAKRVSAATGFSALLTEEVATQDTDEEPTKSSSKSKKSKKKRKSLAKETAATPASPPIIGRNEKKGSKKPKGKGKKTDVDDLDRAIAELSLQYPGLQARASTPKTTSKDSLASALSALLSVSTAHLDSEAEMRKFFGSKVIQANKATSPTTNRRNPVTNRSALTRPRPNWPMNVQREGLSIRPLTDEEIQTKFSCHRWNQPPPEEKWWTVNYSQRYKSLTKAFLRTVYSGDPQGFWDLHTRHSPWHADTLLQIAEVHRHREEHSEAIDMVDRALFTYERSFVGAFTFTTGLNRLEFDCVENRPFFLAVHRQVADLQRRGCMRTAFEFSRLLYSIDPWGDPHGALLHLDFVAVKAGMNQWLLDTFETFSKYQDELKDSARLDPTVLPGWMFTRALCLRMSKLPEEQEASTSALSDAITSFPSVVPLLADKLDVTLPPAISGHRDFRIETDGSFLAPNVSIAHLLSHLYALRSFGIWRDHVPWFLDVVKNRFTSLPPALPITPQRKRFMEIFTHPSPQYAVYRHVVVLESSLRRLLSFVPRSILSEKSLACDPLPPPQPITAYDEHFFVGVDDRLTVTSRRDTNRRLERLIPDANVRDQLRALWNANPDFAARFGGDIVAFAQQIVELPEDMLDGLMIAEAMANHGMENRGMPGQLPGMRIEDMIHENEEDAPGIPDDGGGDDDEEDEETDTSSEDDERENIAPLPVRVLRNILGRFWGGAPAANELSSSDEQGQGDHLTDDDGV